MNPCTKEQEIAQLYKVLIGGNGQPSVVQQLTTLNANLKTYMDRQEDLIKEFGITNREFYEFKMKVVTTDKERQRSKAVGRWVIGLLVGLLGTSMIILSAWTLENRKENKTMEANLRDLIILNSRPRGSVVTTPVKTWAPDSAHIDSVVNSVLKR